MCGHGEWLSWIKANVRIEKSRVYQYMQCAELPVTGQFEDQESNWRRISGKAPADEDEAAWSAPALRASASSKGIIDDTPGRAFPFHPCSAGPLRTIHPSAWPVSS